MHRDPIVHLHSGSLFPSVVSISHKADFTYIPKVPSMTECFYDLTVICFQMLQDFICQLIITLNFHKKQSGEFRKLF